MNDLGKQICRCIVGACDDTCRHYDAEKSCCVGYEEVVQQAEKVFSEYEGYKDLEEQNRLIKLPCAVGDTVYYLDRFCSGTSLDCPCRPCESCEDYKLEIYEGKFKLNDINDFGKTVFLTREEAEAALEELERGKGE